MRSLRLLLLAALMFALQCVPVMAAAGDHDLTKNGEAYTLVYETNDAVGTQVAFIMMAGNSLMDGKVPINAADDIVYIDQTAVAAGTGTNTVSFNGFIPMTNEKEYYSLYLGGLTDGPVWVATISPSKGIISGNVEFFGAGSASLNLYDSTKTTVVNTTTVTKTAQDPSATFEFPNLVEGTYYIKSEKKDYCVSEFMPVTISEADLYITNIVYKMYGGDVNNNGEINIYDISALLDDFGKTGTFTHQGSDVNVNGSVNIYDISALLDGFGKKN